ncbi:MAG: hypothetical protein HKO57_11845, partial [Akkermansiaceae bacterium]|nr:hypothetical protein [Akkermansiaceae bacterium]
VARELRELREYQALLEEDNNLLREKLAGPSRQTTLAIPGIDGADEKKSPLRPAPNRVPGGNLSAS